MTMMSKVPTGRGYAALVAKRVMQDTDGALLGVQLGRLCVTHNIPIIWVAQQAGVSRQCVYNWFLGTSIPQGDRRAAVENLLAQLRESLS